MPSRLDTLRSRQNDSRVPLHSGAEGTDDTLYLARAPVNLDAAPAQRTALLETIALAGTRVVNRAAGVILLRPDWTSLEMPKS